MKLKTGIKEYESLGVESKTFSVDTNDTMIIKLLRDKMYKNKIGAVCREVVSNSRDANREAGRENVPVIVDITSNLVSLLSDEEIYITFQDNGVGISPDRMENIFLKYGGSTKRDSDKYTGGFGIGAKTPFAYSNEFLIITIVEEKGVRTKYEYQAIITSDGKSEVSRMMLVGSEVTSEQTGTKVCVPIKEEDRIKFEKELIYATCLWKVKPILKGFTEKTTISVLKETKDYIVLKDKYDSRENFTMFGTQSFIALIDEIPYKLEKDKLEELVTLNSISKKIGDTTKVVFKYNTGEVSVSGSREDVEYIKDNFKEFEKKAKIFLKEGEDDIEKFLNSATSYVEACKVGNLIHNAQSRYYYGQMSLQEESINGFSVDYINVLGKISSILDYNNDTIYREFNGVKSISRFSPVTYNLNNYSIVNGRMKKSYDLGYNDIGSSVWKKPFYYMDLAKAEPTRNAMLKQTHSEGYIIVNDLQVDDVADYHLEGMGKGREEKFNEIREKEDEILKLLGIETKLYSEVEKLRKEKSTGRNITDIISVKVRYREKTQNYRNNDWVGLSLKFDKKNNEFVNLKSELNNLCNSDKIFSQTTKVACFTLPTLSDFNDGRGNAWNTTPGMTQEQDAIRKLLANLGVLVLGISEKSKTSYFEKGNIKSMQETLVEVLEGESGEILKSALKYTLIKNLNLDLSILSKIKMPTKVKSSFKELKDLKTSIHDKSNKDDRLLKLIDLLSKTKLTNEFIEKNKIDLGIKFNNSIKTYNKFIENNLMLSFIVEVQSEKNTYGNSFNKKSPNFQKGVENYIEIFNKI